MLSAAQWRLFSVAFIAVLLFFLYAIFFGYQASILTSFPDVSPALAAFAGLVAVIWVSVLLRVYGRLRMAIITTPDPGQAGGLRLRSWIVVALVLIFSAVGVLTAATLIFEGPVILREDLARARERLTALKETVKNDLRLTKYENLRAQVEAKLTALREEISAPGNCGMGPTARERLEEIRQLLPDVRSLSSDNVRIPCSDATSLDNLRNAYTNIVMVSLNNLEMAVQGRYPERKELIGRTEQVVADHDRKLAKRQEALAGLSSMIARINLYIDTVRELTAANADYIKIRQEASALAPTINNLPENIGSQASENVSRPLSVFSILLGRLNYISTYIYSVVPILFDFLMLSLISYAVWLRYQRRQQAINYNQAADVEGTQVVLLWAPRDGKVG